MLLLVGGMLISCGARSGLDVLGSGSAPDVPAVGGKEMESSKDEVHKCPFGFADCEAGDPVCETEIAALERHCGECGRACAGGLSCAEGECRSPREVVEVSAGRFHACVRRAGGKVLCWGQNDLGQLGRGYTSPFESRPAPVVGLDDAVELVSGIATNCARRRSGEIACWGQGKHHVFGNESERDSSAIVDVPSVPGVAALALSTDSHVLALTREGDLWGWGNNRDKALLDDPRDDVRSPIQLQVTALVAVAASNANCAILRSGRVACWGSNDTGDIADFKAFQTAEVPVEVAAIERATAITAGWSMAAIDTSGAGFSWGCWPATCSVGATVAANAVKGSAGLVAMKSGPLHSCALRGDGHVRCFGLSSGWWGDDVYARGLFGDGQPTDPLRGIVHFEDASDLPGIGDAVGLDIASVSTCVVRAGGRVSCWGDNRYGQLGDDTLETREVPVDVVGLD